MSSFLPKGKMVYIPFGFASLFMFFAFFCSFVWNQNFNLFAALCCLICLTGAFLCTLGGGSLFYRPLLAHKTLRFVIGSCILLFIWTWVRALTSDVPSTSLLSASYYSIPFIVAAVTMRLCFEGSFRWLMGGMIAIILFIILSGIKQVFWDGFAGRVDWPMQNPNHTAMILNATFILGLGFFVLPRYRAGGAFIMLLSLVGILLAASRAGMIALVLGVAVFAFLIMPRIQISRRGIIIISLSICALILTITLLRPHDASAFFNLIRGFSNLESLHGSRPEIWLATLHLIFERPILGYGTGTFVHVYPSAMTPTHINSGFASHNDLLQMTLETGMIGGLLYAGLGLSIVLAAYHTEKQSRDVTISVFRIVALSVMATIGIHAQIEFMLMVVPVLMIFGVALGVFVMTSCQKPDPPLNKIARATRQELGIGIVMSALLLLSVTQTYAQISANRAQDSLSRGDTASFIQDMEKSSFYGLDLNATPYYLQAYYLLSAWLSSNGAQQIDFSEIRHLLEQAINRNPYLSSVYELSGGLDLLEGKSPEAEYLKGLHIEPRNADIRLALLKYYENTNQGNEIQALITETRRWNNLRGNVGGLKIFLDKYPEPNGL